MKKNDLKGSISALKKNPDVKKQAITAAALMRITAATLMAAGVIVSGGKISENTAITAYAATTLDWYSVSLDTDGNCSWTHNALPAGEAVDKYEIRLSRQNNGSWTANYKTYTTTENSYSINFSAKGKYYVRIRAKMIGGTYTDWSPESSTVAITSDDISTDDSPSAGNSYYYYYNSDGSYYAYGPGGSSNYNYYGPAGPGAGSYSNTSVINTVTGAYVSGNANVGNTQNTANGSGANQASGWIKNANRYMYRYSNGTYAKNGWDRIDNYWYYFDANGYMKTGWLHIDNRWYYALPSGRIATSSWNNINEKWYYFNESGIMQTGYITVDGKMYYTDSSGARVQSAYNPDGHLFDLNGVMIQ